MKRIPLVICGLLGALSALIVVAVAASASNWPNRLPPLPNGATGIHSRTAQI